MSSAKVIQVIETQSYRGQGTTENPYRTVTQYWHFDGRLLAEYDPAITHQATV